MTPSDDSRHGTRTRATDALFAFLKTLPLGDRLIEGGFMAVQAVAGASLAFGIGQALHTEQAFWAAITAIAVSQHSYIDTRKLSRDQFIGAMVGGLCGLFGAVAGGGHFGAYAATVAGAILICWIVNVGSAARLGGITATIMLLVPG
ncbi:FUSC family protein, partial [Paraburkholderia sp.]|uniref:FUSC family protein n=1 Tax=Paraburkholderia sp. TaxID=1926495 RepID=UPI002F4087C8